MKQLKAELMHRTSTTKSNSKHPARVQELEYEVEVYREELLRLRSLLSQHQDSKESDNTIGTAQQRTLLDEVSPNVSSHMSHQRETAYPDLSQELKEANQTISALKAELQAKPDAQKQLRSEIQSLKQKLQTAQTALSTA